MISTDGRLQSETLLLQNKANDNRHVTRKNVMWISFYKHTLRLILLFWKKCISSGINEKTLDRIYILCRIQAIFTFEAKCSLCVICNYWTTPPSNSCFHSLILFYFYLLPFQLPFFMILLFSFTYANKWVIASKWLNNLKLFISA